MFPLELEAVDQENVLVADPEPSAEPAQEAPEPSRGFIAEWAVTIILLLFGTTSLVQAFVIPTGSMEDTLLIGDHLLVDKLSYAPSGIVSRHILPYYDVQRGDIIVFRYPVDIQQTFVKRAIGIPGDHIRLINKQLILNGKPVFEPYVYHKTEYIDSYRDNFPSEPNVHLQPGARDMLAHHDHYDAGHFSIQRGGLLAPLTGIYDGSSYTELLTSNKSITDAGNPLSGNTQRGGLWKYLRRISIIRVPEDPYARKVFVRIYRNDPNNPGTGSEMLAQIVTVLRTITSDLVPTQVLDVYVLEMENVPGWWSSLSTMVPMFESVTHFVLVIRKKVLLASIMPSPRRAIN